MIWNFCTWCSSRFWSYTDCYYAHSNKPPFDTENVNHENEEGRPNHKINQISCNIDFIGNLPQRSLTNNPQLKLHYKLDILLVFQCQKIIASQKQWPFFQDRGIRTTFENSGPLCSNVVWNPRSCKNSHCFCEACISLALKHKEDGAERNDDFRIGFMITNFLTKEN